jgi:hypothetical protein
MHDQLTGAKRAAHDLVGQLRFDIDRAGVVALSGDVELVQPLTSVQADIDAAIDGLTISDGTNLAGGVDMAHQELRGARNRPDAQAVMILLSDGQNNRPGSPIAAAQSARDDAIRLIVVGYRAGTAVKTLRAMASPGDFYSAGNPAELDSIYIAIGSDIHPCSDDHAGSRMTLDAQISPRTENQSTFLYVISSAHNSLTSIHAQAIGQPRLDGTIQPSTARRQLGMYRVGQRTRPPPNEPASAVQRRSEYHTVLLRTDHQPMVYSEAHYRQVRA